MSKPQPQTPTLEGWRAIAAFLGQPVSVAQRWAKSGMPVLRAGRSVQALPVELNRWLGRESSGEPVQIVTESTDLSSELRRALSRVRNARPAAEAKNALGGQQWKAPAPSRTPPQKTSNQIRLNRDGSNKDRPDPDGMETKKTKTKKTKIKIQPKRKPK